MRRRTPLAAVAVSSLASAGIALLPAAAHATTSACGTTTVPTDPSAGQSSQPTLTASDFQLPGTQVPYSLATGTPGILRVHAAGGTGGIVCFEYLLDGQMFSTNGNPTIAADAQGNASIIVTPQQWGGNYLRIHAIDQAGNVSSDATLSFFVAAGASYYYAPQLTWSGVYGEALGANFTVTPATPPPPPGGTYPAVATYQFDFGDGVTASEDPATTNTAHHTYAAPGTYATAVRLLDAQGRIITEDAKYVSIPLAQPPAPNPTPTPTPTPAPTPSPVPVPTPTSGAADPKVYRDAGADRVGTGIAISQQRWTSARSAKAVVLATSLNYPDALSGGPLAARKGGPLLLTAGTASQLDPRVLAEIRRVLPAGGPVHVLGGDGAMNPAIVDQLKSLGYAVTQYKGTDRADTALRVARDGMGSPQHVVLATGAGFADALAAGPYAAGPFADAPGAPAAIVLSDGAHLDPATAAFLNGKTVATVGAQAGHAWPTAAKSFSGVNRFDTAARVAREFTGAFANTQVGIANGTASTTNPGYPDALTGGAFMAESQGPIILVDGINSDVPTESAAALAGRKDNVRADIFGGATIITPSLAASIVALLHGTAQF